MLNSSFFILQKKLEDPLLQLGYQIHYILEITYIQFRLKIHLFFKNITK